MLVKYLKEGVIIKLYKRLLVNAFKQKIVFRINYCVDIVFSFLYIFLQVMIWKGLYKGYEDWNGISLNEMI